MIGGEPGDGAPVDARRVPDAQTAMSRRVRTAARKALVRIFDARHRVGDARRGPPGIG
jgi:hypothetical protein